MGKRLKDKAMGNYLVDVVSDRDANGNPRRRAFRVSEVIQYFEARGGIPLSPDEYRRIVRDVRGPEYLNAEDAEILGIE